VDLDREERAERRQLRQPPGSPGLDRSGGWPSSRAGASGHGTSVGLAAVPRVEITAIRASYEILRPRYQLPSG
jgi:hypothetical protein